MKADPKADAAPKASKKKLIVIVAAAVLVLGLGGGSAWFFTRSTKGGEEHKEVKVETTPEFVAIEPFTVNLQPENGEQYLQIQFSLQVPDAAAVEVFKKNMPKARSRLLLLLSGKRASEINSIEGKRALAAEIIAAMNQPFADKGTPQKVSEVLYTSFIIQ